MAEAVRQRIDGLDQGNPFIAPSTNGMVLYPGMDGGAEWGGAAYDESHQRRYINSNEVPYLLQLTPVSKELGLGPQLGYLSLCAGCHGADMRGDGVSVPGLLQLSDRLSPLEAYNIVARGRGRMPAFPQIPWYAKAAIVGYVYTADEKEELDIQEAGSPQAEMAYLNAGFQKLTDPEGLPASKPPWGTLTAIDLKHADILWRIPLGDYPELLAQGESGYGSENYGGPIVTAGDLLFIAATPNRFQKPTTRHVANLRCQPRCPPPGSPPPLTYAFAVPQYRFVPPAAGTQARSSVSRLVASALPDYLPCPVT